ncbi:uncharacterized protein B0H18DRAFT_1211172, partial [Fomitopsis serialis]|uniref:uncharacterized protein n=1 Tax=Fomitopsis serialis TaxID=139415 RepID=UPI0020074AD2
MPAATAVKAVTVSDDPQVYEDAHVHSVYDEIAPHFSSTRYKPWPIIAQFLSSLPAGPGSVWTIGLDRSRNLLEIAQGAGGTRREWYGGSPRETWRAGAFVLGLRHFDRDIHHLSTPARRKWQYSADECISPSH